MRGGVFAVFVCTFVFLAVSCLSIVNTGSDCPGTDELRWEISESFGIDVYDNCSLDSDQLGVIYNILESVPKPLYNLSKIIAYDMAGSYAHGYYGIIIPDIEVGESGGDNIPDGINQYADNFSIYFVHELNRDIRNEYHVKAGSSKYREYELIYSAGPNQTNYIRSDYPDGFFFQMREEFFPKISGAYFQDSELTFDLVLQRFGDGYSEPLNQFLFFADVYSLGSNETRFYTLDENGVITERRAHLGRDNRGHISSLSFEGDAYYFGLDHEGNVLNVSKGPPQPQPDVCKDDTLYNECSHTKPLYCESGNLIEKCSICSCDQGYYCENEECIAYPEECSDRTPYGNCSKTLPYYCEGGALVEKCSVCGCYPYSFCNLQNDSCQYNQTFHNHPPALNLIGYKKVREGELLEFVVFGFDVDQEVISYYAYGLPGGAKFDRNSRKFQWVPGYEQAGNYEVIFTVSDNEFNDSEIVTVEVIDVNRRPEATISYPSDKQGFYVNELIVFIGKDSEDPDGDRLAYIWSFGDGGTGEGPVVNHTYRETGTYKATLEVSDSEKSGMESIALKIKPREEPILDDDRDGIENSRDRCPDTPSLKRVNIYGCPLPVYRKFKNNLTTDFSKIDTINATDIIIGIPKRVKIEFRKNKINLVDKDLDRYVKIEEMSIEIETEQIPELNKSAVITFYNVTIEDPLILMDGKYCKECEVIWFSNGTFTFSVPHFTRYSLMAWASFSGYCGDELCSIYETCYDCSMDCGECKEPESPSPCEEYWMCNPWSECSELNLRKRECNDVNLCGTTRAKPKEVMECEEEPFPSLSIFGIIVFVLTTIYLVTEHYKKKGELRKLSRYELHEIIKGYMYRGFTKEQIRKTLKSKGYTDKEITKLLEEAEREMF